MANFPTSLPGLKSDFDSEDPIASADQNDSANEVNAIGAKVGIDSSAVTTSHDYKLSGVTGTDKAVSKTGTETLTNKTLTSPTINTPTMGAGSIDAITEIASALKSGSDTTIVTGTKGTDGDLSQWNADGDLVDGPTPPSGTIVGTTDTQTLTNKTLTSPVLNTAVSGTAVLDEDNMVSDSATKVATQQSIKAYVDGLQTKDSVLVYKSGNQSIAANTEVDITFDTESWDVGALHSTVSNTDRLTAVEAGKYWVHAYIQWTTDAVGSRWIKIYHNTTLVIREQKSAASQEYMEVHALVNLAATEYVKVSVEHDSTTDPLNVIGSAASNTHFAMIKLSN